MKIWQTFTASERGGRNYNEDCCGFIEHCDTNGVDWGCWVLADGLGGHGGGDVASQLAVEYILDSFIRKPAMDRDSIWQYFLTAQRVISEKQQLGGSLAAMRTTVVMLVSDGINFNFANIGDSRLYLLRNGECQRALTHDHSVSYAFYLNKEINYEQIRRHPDRNRLIRALGNDKIQPDISSPQPLLSGDSFVLCSDGCWDYVTEDDIMQSWRTSTDSKDWGNNMLERLQNKLVEQAITNNDNYSIMAIRQCLPFEAQGSYENTSKEIM